MNKHSNNKWLVLAGRKKKKKNILDDEIRVVNIFQQTDLLIQMLSWFLV
jgi:hypothetical protein